MLTLKDLFYHDFGGFRHTHTFFLHDRDPLSGEINKVEIIRRVVDDLFASTRIFAYYIPDNPFQFTHIKWAINTYNEQALELFQSIRVKAGIDCDHEFGQPTLMVSNRIFFYTFHQFSDHELQSLNSFCTDNGINIIIRSTNYLDMQIKERKPIVFISHDSGDKAKVARILAEGLIKRGCPTWYDEYSLTPGDSLMDSIDKGIKEVDKCVIILSKGFIQNQGYCKREFTTMVQREIIDKQKIIIPIWYDVTPKEVYDFWGPLSDILAFNWPKSKGRKADKYRTDVETLINRLFSQLTGTVVHNLGTKEQILEDNDKSGFGTAVDGSIPAIMP